MCDEMKWRCQWQRPMAPAAHNAKCMKTGLPPSAPSRPAGASADLVIAVIPFSFEHISPASPFSLLVVFLYRIFKIWTSCK
jgi:hypothetical protein